jgi:DNA repair photolyase
LLPSALFPLFQNEPCLESLLRNGFPISILTRSPLVLRDLELLKRFDWVRVGMSIATVPSKQFEPGVPPLQRRIDTLKKLAKAGIRTWVSLALVVPRLIMVDLDRLFECLRDAGVSSVSFGVIRFTGYEESRRMFEEAVRMSAADALAGQEEVVPMLTDLVRRYGMEPTRDAKWKPEPSNDLSLDSYYN